MLDGDHFVVNGQKVWTSGAHDADVILTFVRTDPDAPKHKGISALIIPTDTPGMTRRPFGSVTGPDDLDFNEVFFDDVVVPAENLLGELHGGWRVANGSLGHERAMLWLDYSSNLDTFLDDFAADVGAEALLADPRRHGLVTPPSRSTRRRSSCSGSAHWPRPSGAWSRTRSRSSSCSGRRRSSGPRAGRGVARARPRSTTPGTSAPLNHMQWPPFLESWFTATCAASPAPSPAAPRRSSATSSAERVLGLPRS